MKFLYTPWRSNYVKDKPETKKENATESECVFCKKLKENKDEENFILERFEHNFILLNLHPYNTGHIMVLPNRHVSKLYNLNTEEQYEFMLLSSHANKILEESLKCEGMNIGLNLGKTAGAGIPSHLHLHLIPRWQGDTNFLPLTCDVKTISFDLNKIYNDLKPKFNELKKILLKKE